MLAACRDKMGFALVKDILQVKKVSPMLYARLPVIFILIMRPLITITKGLNLRIG